MCGTGLVNESQMEQIAALNAKVREVSQSPFGPADQIGMLNHVTAESVHRVITEIGSGKVFDLAVDYFIGMPSWTQTGDPSFQMWMSHTPAGTVIDDPAHVGRVENELVSYSGDCITMYTHTGTHVDTLAHFGYHGRIWNGFSAADHLGSRGWKVAGADKHPPVIARGILLDIARTVGVDVLPDSYAIGEQAVRETLAREEIAVQPGDVVLIRTGRMGLWSDPSAFGTNSPGINREAAEYLAKAGAIMIGADTLTLEQIPSADVENWQGVHTYLLAEAGVPILEVANLEELAKEEMYKFAFVGATLKIQGATGGPMRPLALPLAS